MEKRTHKIINHLSNQPVFVGTSEQCNDVWNKNENVVASIVPLSTEPFKYKLIDVREISDKTICLSSEINCYSCMTDLCGKDLSEDWFLVIELTEEESKLYIEKHTKQIKSENMSKPDVNELLNLSNTTGSEKQTFPSKSGKTTQQVDYWIEYIFSHPNESVEILCGEIGNHSGDNELFDKIVKRIRREFPHDDIGYLINSDGRYAVYNKINSVGIKTRMVNNYIQKLFYFPNEPIGICDNVFHAEREIFSRIVERLTEEHPTIILNLLISGSLLEIKLVSNEPRRINLSLSEVMEIVFKQYSEFQNKGQSVSDIHEKYKNEICFREYADSQIFKFVDNNASKYNEKDSTCSTK